MYDFWLMVHHNSTDYSNSRPAHSEPRSSGVQKVVMLTNFIENNRQKCETYFPLEVDEEMTVCNSDREKKETFLIKNLGLIKKAGYTIRKLDVRYSESEGESDKFQRQNTRNRVVTMGTTQDVSESSGKSESDSGNSELDTANSENSVTVYHYLFHNWADHKCPKDVNALLNLSLDVLRNSDCHFNRSPEGDDECLKCDSPKPESKFVFPPLEAPVPCGIEVSVSTPLDLTDDTLCPPAIVHCSAGIGRTGCLIAILNGIKQLANESKVDVLGIVCNMRLNRGGMVQNSEQYELIHKVLCLYEQACMPAFENTK